jgi:putative CocE/NonD family hydrolase
VVTECDRDVKIPLPDGVELAATLYRPRSSNPVPATVTYPPYRKDDFNAIGDEYPAQYFAEHGYASLIVDMRGCGASEGVRWETLHAAKEGGDGHDVVEWIAAQRWCDGNVAMWGISYPGWTSLATAAQQPPHLKAIASIMPPTDAYEVWYPSRVSAPLLAGTWAGMMLALELLPPGRQDPQGRWYEIWLDRLDRFAERSQEWRTHPDPSDEYWTAHRVDVSKIQAATFMIGGWRDLFPREVLGTYVALTCPRKLLMGPWEHNYPNADAVATTDHLELMRRWFDRWLKNNGVAVEGDSEPDIAYYVLGAEKWRGEPEWPITRVQERTLYLGAKRRLATGPVSAGEEEIAYVGDPRVGAQSLLHDGLSIGIAAAQDQGPDDLASITFDGEPLADALEIAGLARATVFVIVDEGEELDLTIRLNDVAPDGASSLITWGSANLKADGPNGASFTIGEITKVEVTLYPIGYHVPAGHRLRVSVACADFPRHWPSSVNPHLRLVVGGEHESPVCLPVMPNADWEALLLPEPSANPMPLLVDADGGRSIERDVTNHTVATTTRQRQSSRLPSGSGMIHMENTFRFTVAADRPDAARAETDVRASMDLDGGTKVRVDARTWQTRQALWGAVTIELNGERFFERSLRI